MHDLSTLREYDETVVVDVPEGEPWRPPTAAEAVMFVQLPYADGLKHKLQPGQLLISCEQFPLIHAEANIHPEKLDGTDYCPVCFTPAELRRALEPIARRRNDSDGYVGMTPLSKSSRTRTRGYTAAPKPKK